MLRQNRPLLWLLVLVLTAACAPVLSAAPAVPTLDAAAINTIVAQTAAAASTQTSEAVAASMPTPTPPPSPTATPTFILVYLSPTAPTLPPMATSTSKVTGSRDYACRILKSPENGVTYAPRTRFNAVWQFQNTGRQIWDSEKVVFVYDSGDRFHVTAAYNLPKTAEFGDVAEFIVEMEAPKNPGAYTTYWTLQNGGEKFCTVSLSIIVKE
ncbi:MAG: NBR1-Ig-like domain-containing protein [Chloroflexota bacterium]